MKKFSPQINASSMADIAFLLLIFFLVTTTIVQDEGLLNLLPPDIEVLPSEPHKARNVLEILVNRNNQILAEENVIEIGELKNLTVKHLKNNGADLGFSETPAKAIVLLKNDRAASYDMYIQIQNELKAAYTQVRNDEALILTNQQYNYNQLRVCIEDNKPEAEYCQKIKDVVQNKYPMTISEPEPIVSR